MSDWLVPVLTALIAAGAVFITNVFNGRNSTMERRETRKERAADREHEMEKWRAEREADRQQWLLDRRSEAYVSLLEWAHREPKDPQVKALRSTIDVHLRAYGGAPLIAAYEDWLNAPVADSGFDSPRWLEVMKRMREDLGSE